MRHTSKSRKVMEETIRRPERDDGCSTDVPVFQTGSRAEMLEFARQTAVNSAARDSDSDDKPKAAIRAEITTEK